MINSPPPLCLSLCSSSSVSASMLNVLCDVRSNVLFDVPPIVLFDLISFSCVFPCLSHRVPSFVFAETG